MIKVAVVGLGKMGISHLSIFRAHPDVEVVGVCDSTGYVLDILGKYTGLTTYTDYSKMLAHAQLDAVVIATPSFLHASMVREALDRGLDVFCEKPFCLDDADGKALTAHASESGRVTQVGYHNRFVASFREMKSLLNTGAIGDVSHVLAEAYGPVVLKAKGGTWRSRRSSGGGCLYDYAAHPIDLVNWYLGMPCSVAGSRLTRIFSSETEDQVISTLMYPKGVTAQVSVNWSDESQRKMSTKITAWGTGGFIYADRQEIRVFVRGDSPPPGYRTGWNVRYTTELTIPVSFYLRGEEYSAQADDFVQRVKSRAVAGDNTFESAAATDQILSRIIEDSNLAPSTNEPPAPSLSTRPGRRWWRLPFFTRRNTKVAAR